MSVVRTHFAMAALTASLVALAIAWGSFACWPAPGLCGKFMARIDLAHGRYRVLTYGLSVPWRTRYARILRKRYGVELSVVGEDLVSASTSDFTDGYDRVSTEAIRRRFGRDALPRAYAEARFGWEEYRVPMDSAQNDTGAGLGPQAVSGAFRVARPSGSAISTRWAAISMLRK